MANSASDAGKSEYEIRKKMIEEGIISQMVTLPSNMFSSVTLPATLWFFDKHKPRTDKKNEILDSHIVKIGETYHLFYKNANDPSGNMHETARSLYGPFTHDDEMDRVMRYYTNAGAYEGATTYVLPDGRWCLMLDFFGCPFYFKENGEGFFPEPVLSTCAPDVIPFNYDDLQSLSWDERLFHKY